MNRARPKSRRVSAPRIHAPTTRIETIGSRAVIDVFSDRISTWFSDRFAMSSYDSPLRDVSCLAFSSMRSNTTMPS
jgi:hypothetical protein